MPGRKRSWREGFCNDYPLVEMGASLAPEDPAWGALWNGCFGRPSSDQCKVYDGDSFAHFQKWPGLWRLSGVTESLWLTQRRASCRCGSTSASSAPACTKPPYRWATKSGWWGGKGLAWHVEEAGKAFKFTQLLPGGLWAGLCCQIKPEVSNFFLQRAW